MGTGEGGPARLAAYTEIMSTKAVIIALVIALCLGIGAYLVLQPAPKPKAAPDAFASGERVCSLDPARVQSIEVAPAQGSLMTLQRSGDGQWALAVARQSTRGAGAWPLEEGRVPNLLRVMDKLQALDTPQANATMGPDAMRVTVRTDDGKSTTFLLSSRTLTGRGLLKVIDGGAGKSVAELIAGPGKLAVVDDSIHRVFREPGPLGWRDTTALRGVGPDVTRITAENNELKLKLGRIQGAWALQEPVSAPADVSQVAKLVATLSGLRITDFLDDGAPQDDITGLDAPIARVTAETDRRSITDEKQTVSTRTETQTLIVGKPADSAAKTRYARLGDKGSVVVIAGEGLARELFDPIGYVSKKAAQTPVPDVGMLVIERVPVDTAADAAAPAPPAPLGRVFRRNLETWKEVSGASEVTVDETMGKAVADLLRFMTAENAASVSLQPPTVWKEEGSIVIGSLSGMPLETIVIGATDGPNLGVRTGGTGGKGSVYRWYPRDRAPGLIATFLPAPTKPVKPADDREPDVMK